MKRRIIMRRNLGGPPPQPPQEPPPQPPQEPPALVARERPTPPPLRYATESDVRESMRERQAFIGRHIRELRGTTTYAEIKEKKANKRREFISKIFWFGVSVYAVALVVALILAIVSANSW